MPNAPAPAENQLPIGIDLGTTYSVVAYVDATGRPTTVPNQAGDLLTPSAVAFEEGQVIVGKEAVKGSVLEPDAFADCFKRDMGRGYFRRQVGGHEVPPEVLNGFLLERLRQDAERRLGPIRRVVITVPAFFDETRRKATQEAGKLAGLVPSAWERSRQAALAAAEELRKAEHETAQLEAARRSAASASEAARRDVPLAQARRTVQEIQTRVRFAQLALGRECARSGFVPADLKRDEALIKKLEAQLQGG